MPFTISRHPFSETLHMVEHVFDGFVDKNHGFVDGESIDNMSSSIEFPCPAAPPKEKTPKE